MPTIMRPLGKIRAILGKWRPAIAAFRKSVWQRWKNPSGETTPVFLIGNNASGTSMMVFQMAKSWQITLYHEDNPAAFHNWHLRDLSVIEALLERSYAPVTLFKPILDTYLARVLLCRFPTAKFLFAFRHFDDMINSQRNRFYDQSGRHIPAMKLHPDNPQPPVSRWVTTDFAEFSAAPPPQKTTAFIKARWHPGLNVDSNIALRWLFVNHLFFDLGLHREERVKLVHYESVVAQPEREFKSIFRFLGLEFEPHVIEGIHPFSVRRAPPPSIEPQIRADCEEMWQRLLHHFHQTNA